MHLLRRSAVISSMLAGVILCGACHRSASLAPVPATSPAIAGPTSEKERFEAERWAEATAGLEIDTVTSQVRVDRIETGTPGVAAEHLARADSLLATNRILEALKEYGLAARNAPDLAAPYVGIGVVLKRKGKLDGAIAAFRTAVDLDPGDAQAHYQWAMTLWSAGRQSDALATMGEVLQLEPANAKAHERLAVWSYYTGDYAAAWRHVHRATTLGETLPGQLTDLLASKMPDPGPEDSAD